MKSLNNLAEESGLESCFMLNHAYTHTV